MSPLKWPYYGGGGNPGGGGGGGAVNFLGLADTPSAYTGQGRKVLSVSAAENAVLFSNIANTSNITLVSSIPTVETGEIILLTHDVYQQGNRDDVIVTVDAGGNYVGFNTFEYNNVAQLGDAPRHGPLEAIGGPGVAANYSINQIWSRNKHWLDAQNTIRIDDATYALGAAFYDISGWSRVIINPPTGLSGATFTLNFRTTANNWSYHDGDILVAEAGFWEWVEREIEYKRLLSGLEHYDGAAGPAFLPSHAGQTYVNDEGKLWIGADAITFTDEGPSLTKTALASPYFLGISTSHHDIVPANDGEFAFMDFLATSANAFRQRRGGNVSLHTWTDVWTYIITLAGQDTAANQGRRDAIFFGGYASEAAAARALNQRTDRAGNTFFYSILADSIYEVDSFSSQTLVRHDDLHWRGPLTINTDILALIREFISYENSTGGPTDVPTRAGILRTNAAGDVYKSVSAHIAHNVLASFTEAAVAVVPKNNADFPYWRGALPFSNINVINGYFEWLTHSNQWSYIHDIRVTSTLSWGVITHEISNQNPAHAPTGFIGSHWLNGPNHAFDTDEEAATFLAGEIAAGRITNSNTQYYIWLLRAGPAPADWELRLAPGSAYNAAVTTYTDSVYWERVPDKDDVPDGGFATEPIGEQHNITLANLTETTIELPDAADYDFILVKFDAHTGTVPGAEWHMLRLSDLLALQPLANGTGATLTNSLPIHDASVSNLDIYVSRTATHFLVGITGVAAAFGLEVLGIVKGKIADQTSYSDEVGEDATITQGDTFEETSVAIPSSADYEEALINFGVVQTGYRDAEWRLFLLQELYERTVATVGDTPSDTNSLAFFGIGTTTDEIRIGRTAAGNFLISGGSATIDPGNPLKIRAR